MVEIRLIDEAHKGDILLKNDPFPLYGQMSLTIMMRWRRAPSLLGHIRTVSAWGWRFWSGDFSSICISPT